MKISKILAKYTGSMLKRYTQAAEKLLECPVNKKDSFIKGFIKVEKLSEEQATQKPPRFIQGRDPKYNLALMKYLRPLEHWFYEHSSSTNPLGPQTRTVVKGLNLEQRAALLLEKYQRFADPIAVSLDASKFESHVTTQVLTEEHSFYKKAFNNDPELQRLLDLQRNNCGVTPSGIVYKTQGRRASGDFNTGLGNTLISFASVEAYFANRRVKYDFVVDGDDLLLILERQDRGEINLLPNHYGNLGFIMTMDVWENIEEAVHCQCRIVHTDPPIMVRHFERTLSRAYTSNDYYHVGGALAEAYFHTVSECEARIHRGVPILGPFFSAMAQRTKGSVDLRDHRMKLSQGLTDIKDISFKARLSFQEAFNVDPQTQVQMEHELVSTPIPKFLAAVTQQPWR